jgi:hypothetical protein
MGMGMPMSQPMPAKRSPVGLVIGIVAVLAIVGGVAAFFLTKGPPQPTASNDATTNTATPTAAATTPPADTGAAATPPPTDTTAAVTPPPADTPSATPPAAVAVNNATNKTTTGGGALAAIEKKTPEAKTPEPPKTAEPPPAKTAEAPAASGKEFDRNAAMSALGAAAGAARGCKKPDGPTGSGKVKVIFAPSGNVTSATVEGGPFAGTPTGGCVASAFRGAHVPSFDGSSVAVSKSFSIN